MATLQDIRSQYPQYDDMSDQDLADKFYSKFYSDMPRDDFDKKLGIAPIPTTTAAPSFKEKAAQAIGAEMRGPVGQIGAGALEGLARLPGAPLDIMAAGGNFLRRQFGLPETQLADTSAKDWGSQGWEAWARRNGVIPSNLPTPTTPEQAFARKAGNFAGGSLPFGPSAMIPAATGAIGSEVGKTIGGDTGEVVGGIIGSLAPAGASAALAGTRSALTPVTTAPKAELAQEMMNRGVPILPAQLAESPATRGTYQMLTRVLPFESKALSEQQSALNKATGSLIEAPVENLTANVVGTAKQAIGQRIGATAAKADIPITPQVEARLQASLPNPNKVTAENYRIAKGHLDEILEDAKNNGGILSGSKFHDYTNYKSDLAKLARSDTDPLQNFAGNLRKTLTSEWKANASPTDQLAFTDALQKYRTLMTLEPILGRSPTGQIQPGRFLGALKPATSHLGSRTGGELETLARGSDEFIRPLPSSQTGENVARMGIAVEGANALGQAAAGNFRPLMYLVTQVTGAQAWRKMLEDPALTRKMINIALSPKTPIPLRQKLLQIIPAATKKLAPAAPALIAAGGQNLSVAN